MLSKFVIILCSVVLMTSVARAEHKLLITDVLDKGQVEAEAEFDYTYSSYNYTLRSPVIQQGEVNRYDISSSYSLAAGITEGLQFSVTIPYVFQHQEKYEYISPSFPSRTFKTNGWGDPTIGGRYRVMGGEAKPFTLVVGLNVKPDIANKNKVGTGTTDIAPYIAAGTTLLNGKLRPFASYLVTISNHGASDSHDLSMGAEYVFNGKVSLVPTFSARFRTSSSTQEPYESYAFGLASFCQVARNLYLIPSVRVGVSTAHRTSDGSFNFDTLTFANAGLSLYYLFN